MFLVMFEWKQVKKQVAKLVYKQVGMLDKINIKYNLFIKHVFFIWNKVENKF